MISHLLDKYPIPEQETALKDVPTGVKFKIINSSDLPSDFRDAWEYDFTESYDGVGA